VRLASPLPRTWDSPTGWVDALRRHGFRAAYWPLPDDAGEPEVDAYADAAHAAGVVIAEIGAWHANPISPDEATRASGVERCRVQLALAERVGARCCVNVAGSRGAQWDAPHPDNLSADTFALIVDTVREILDAVQPTRTYFTLEPMPWTLPDSPDSYLALLRAIDRPRFAVHLDPVNFVNSPAKLYDNAALLRECFAKLGPHIRSVHAKDIVLEPRLTVHLQEVRPGLGVLDYAVLLRELARLDPDTPVLVEHLGSEADYAEAVAHIRGVAGALGVDV
jgi:sugar phosphate isomerase/epimerase